MPNKKYFFETGLMFMSNSNDSVFFSVSFICIEQYFIRTT